MSSVKKRPDGKWRARYRDSAGKEHSRHFDRKTDAQDWIDEVTTAVRTGTYVDPKTAKTTVGDWCDTWIEGYRTRRPSTVRQAEVHIAHIRAAFGPQRLADVKPSQVKAWCAKLGADGYADSTVYAIHARLSQIMSDAVHDGVIARNPCSRRTSPRSGKQRPYVATTAQVWALHDAMPEHLRPAVLLGAFAGLRIAEACGLRISDVDFMRGIVSPAVQYPADPLKSEMSRTPVPIPHELALELSKYAAGERWMLEDMLGVQVGPWQVERAVRAARGPAGLPEGFRFHDLRHYFASLLIQAGCDVKIVQTRLRHASATTTLNTYAHMWPDTEESTRAAVANVLTARADSLRTRAASK
ncbi:tyrosine-type recombinase/integrase [Demequina capsici]|uniref:Tyrosine-type recombinase/integrase n=1 Tax=Demequina capsici TaxID=3075620 RepID=A0AA96J8R0_9MICO|nr:tyrosine-type recombinase/integrase [Demequina sp. OYTSA14]WNM25650.1 tyrosine-type recombinase/integrase [Demequina sp. OYTSA14]